MHASRNPYDAGFIFTERTFGFHSRPQNSRPLRKPTINIQFSKNDVTIVDFRRGPERVIGYRSSIQKNPAGRTDIV
jgi:hypothetical protein